MAHLVSREAEANTHKQCVLVVDSEVIVRHAISAYLRECGYDVIEAATTDEATTVLADSSIPVDAMMCDVAAAGSCSGFELSVWTRNERPRLEVILSGTIPAAASAAAQLCDQGPHLARPTSRKPSSTISSAASPSATAPRIDRGGATRAPRRPSHGIRNRRSSEYRPPPKAMIGSSNPAQLR